MLIRLHTGRGKLNFNKRILNELGIFQFCITISYDKIIGGNYFSWLFYINNLILKFLLN